MALLLNMMPSGGRCRFDTMTPERVCLTRPEGFSAWLFCRKLLSSVEHMRTLSRLLPALFGLWFVVVLGDPGVLHACPMHGAHGAGHSAAMTSSGHAGHGEHGSSMNDASSATGAGHHETAPGPCTCVGQCCSAAAVAPVPMVATMHVPEVVTGYR